MKLYRKNWMSTTETEKKVKKEVKRLQKVNGRYDPLINESFVIRNLIINNL